MTALFSTARVLAAAWPLGLAAVGGGQLATSRINTTGLRDAKRGDGRPSSGPRTQYPQTPFRVRETCLRLSRRLQALASIGRELPRLSRVPPTHGRWPLRARSAALAIRSRWFGGLRRIRPAAHHSRPIC